MINIFRIVYILMPLTVDMAFLWAPGAEILGDTSRIIYFHVPAAWASVLSFFVAGSASIGYLFGENNKRARLADVSHNSCVIGMVLIVLATVTGSIWAKMSWGSFWNWDPRETSIIFLLLVYSAYFSLRSALGRKERGSRISSAYLVLAMVTVPFFVFMVPRIYPSLHPAPLINPEKRLFLEDKMRITLAFSLASFTLLYFYILSLMNRISAIEARMVNKRNEK